MQPVLREYIYGHNGGTPTRPLAPPLPSLPPSPLLDTTVIQVGSGTAWRDGFINVYVLFGGPWHTSWLTGREGPPSFQRPFSSLLSLSLSLSFRKWRPISCLALADPRNPWGFLSLPSLCNIMRLLVAPSPSLDEWHRQKCRCLRKNKRSHNSCPPVYTYSIYM